MGTTQIAELNRRWARVPLVIGVTGHRDLLPDEEQQELLRCAFADFLRRLHEEVPNTPLVVLSALAEGADRLAAEVAVSLRGELDISVIAPLPLEQHEYERDFPHTVDDFRTLLREKIKHHFFIGMAEGNTAENVRHAEHRRQQYAALGQYVARNCQVLVAFWNGHDQQKTGGTAHVLAFKKEGIGEFLRTEKDAERCGDERVATPLEPAECGPVFHIRTPRVNDEFAMPGKPGSGEWLYPSVFHNRDKAHAYYQQIWKRIDLFNRDVNSASGAALKDIAAKRTSLLDRPDQAGLSEGQKATLHRYAVADTLAIASQTEMHSTIYRLHWSAFAALLIYDLFIHRGPFFERMLNALGETAKVVFPPLLLVAALAIFCSSIILFLRARRLQCQDKYQDYRALAEGLRVQFYWSLAGINDSVADYYLGKHRSELDWIRNAFRTWGIPMAPPAPVPPQLDLVMEWWVHKQRVYFGTRRDGKKHKRSHKRVRYLLFFAGGMAALIILTSLLQKLQVGWLNWFLMPGKEGPVQATGITLITMALVGAGLLEHYDDKMAFSEHAKQYGRMRTLFAWSEGLIESALKQDRPKRAQALIRDLGIAALEENGDWVLLHRERPLEVPYGG